MSKQSSKPTESEVRQRAYELWEKAGQPEGDGQQFWLEAEKELTSSCETACSDTKTTTDK